jgi:CheY-like chemotaxis protein
VNGTTEAHITTLRTPNPQQFFSPQRSDGGLQSLRGVETILLCEDEEGIREMAVQFLGSLGYKMLAVSSGTEALSLLKDWQTKPDLLLSDLQLPETGGIELARRLRQESPGLKVLLMSGLTFGDFGEGSARYSEYPFIAKPFSVVELARKIREVLGA